jgi:hypothetical protein
MPQTQGWTRGLVVSAAAVATLNVPSRALAQPVDYRVLATNKTSTME